MMYLRWTLVSYEEEDACMSCVIWGGGYMSMYLRWALLCWANHVNLCKHRCTSTFRCTCTCSHSSIAADSYCLPNNFSKLLCIVTFYSNYTRALTFENVSQVSSISCLQCFQYVPVMERARTYNSESKMIYFGQLTTGACQNHTQIIDTDPRSPSVNETSTTSSSRSEFLGVP